MKYGFDKKIYEAWNSMSPDSGRWYECLGCGQNHADALHHNFGRGGTNKRYRKAFGSILNSVPLNNELCHLPSHSKIKRDEYFLEQVFRIVQKAVRKGEYRMVERDEEFYEIHSETYKSLDCKLENLKL
ncbi:hypothetical protein LCGC14_1269280 [marine sediment metagenome]|uniref:Uncharacterized protein n=1 Tax=marine sediment metagenome TaxID=412755 RepID=A0A0F9KYH6_9ZZZZ